MGTTTMGQHRLFLGLLARVVGFIQELQDDVHLLQDVVGHARIPGDLWDRAHAKVLQDLGHVPQQGH
jgi:hypothetical protein